MISNKIVRAFKKWKENIELANIQLAFASLLEIQVSTDSTCCHIIFYFYYCFHYQIYDLFFEFFSLFSSFFSYNIFSHISVCGEELYSDVDYGQLRGTYSTSALK